MLASSLNATHIPSTGTGHSVYIENAPLVNEQICAVVGSGHDC
jgi:hypothetical protein